MRFYIIYLTSLVTCLAQTASMPNALPSNKDMIVASNRAQTTLTAGINSSTLSIAVLTSTNFVPNMLVTIDSEIMQVCSVSSGLLTICPSGRGIDNTTAASHANASTVRGNITALHHNRTRAEVQAIATQIADNRAYNFTLSDSQYSGDLSITGVKTITFTAPNTCPLGVNGSDANHYIYIFGGTGTAETVLITGGTCVAGSTGTLIFTTANTHLNSSISSATAGMAETIQAVGNGASVVLPAGTHTVYGPLDISGRHGVTIRGAGQGSTVIDMAHASNDFILWGTVTDNITIRDLSFTSSIVRTGGWLIRGYGGYASQSLLRWSKIENISVRNQVNGFWITQYAGVTLDHVVMEDWRASVTGIGVKAGQTAATDVNQGSELHVINSHIYGDAVGASLVPALGYAYWIEDTDAVYLGPNSTAGLTTQGVVRYVSGNHGIVNHFVNQFVSDGGHCVQGAGVLFTGTGSITDIMIDNSWFASCGAAVTLTAAGIKVATASVGRFEIRNSRFLNNQGPGLIIDGPTNMGGGPILIANNTFTQNGIGNQANFRDDIYINGIFDQNAPFLTGNNHTGSANGFSVRTSVNTNLLRLGANHWQNGFSFGSTPKSGFTTHAPTATTIGGAPLAAGACTAPATTTVTGAAVGMTVIATPGGALGGAFFPIAYVSAANTVSVSVCSLSAATPNAVTYYLRIEN